MTRHSAIFTNLLLSLPLAAGLLCAAANASAQTAETVTIRFTFSADHQPFPAGTYEVRRLSDGLMSLSNLETRKTRLLMVRSEWGYAVQTRGRLVFLHDETGNSLMQVWIPGTTLHSELTVQRKLKQSVAKNGPSAGSSIVVAMK
jgi:hypothetical protein